MCPHRWSESPGKYLLLLCPLSQEQTACITEGEGQNGHHACLLLFFLWGSLLSFCPFQSCYLLSLLRSSYRTWSKMGLSLSFLLLAISEREASNLLGLRASLLAREQVTNHQVWDSQKRLPESQHFFFLVPRAVCWWPPPLPASLPYFCPFSRLGVPLPACRSKGTINSWTINDLVTLQIWDGQSIPEEWLSVFPLLHTGNKWPQASPSQLLMYQNFLKILEGLSGLRPSLQPVMVLPSGKWWGSLK